MHLTTKIYAIDYGYNFLSFSAFMLTPLLPLSCNNYLIIGGMPECVSSLINYKDPARISRIQQELIEIYENDFSKHNGSVNSAILLKKDYQFKRPLTENFVLQQLECALRFSKRGYRKDGAITNLPLH